MHFNIFFKGISIIWITILITSCNSDNDGITSNQRSINSVDQLQEFIKGINFEVNAPDGSIINFNIDKGFSESATDTYSSSGNGYQFTSEQNFNFDIKDSGGATLYLDTEIIKFQYVLCSTISEISREYPEVIFSPEIKNYLIFIAIGKRDGNVEDLFYYNSQNAKDNILEVLLDPFQIDNYGFYSSDNFESYYLMGEFQYDKSILNSHGAAYNYWYNSNLKSYSLELHCN